MMQYYTEPRTRKYVKGYGFLSFARKYKKQLLNTGLDASKNVFHKAGEFLGNKIIDTVLSKILATQTKSNDDNNEKQEPVEGIIIPPEKREEILNILRKVLKKWNTIKYLNY